MCSKKKSIICLALKKLRFGTTNANQGFRDSVLLKRVKHSYFTAFLQ